MKKAAQFGRGSYVFIQNLKDVQQKMTRFMTKISQPAISNITLEFENQVEQHIEVYPKKIPDLYFAEPLQIALKSQAPITSMQLAGESASEPWYQQLIVDENQSSKGISSLWARRKIESLLDTLVVGANKEKVKAQVIATSLNHQIISPYTSFIAVEKQPEVQSLFAENNMTAHQKSTLQKAKHRIVQAHENLMVALPQTALGWQLQLMIGITLLLLSLMIKGAINFTWLANRRNKKAGRREKPH